MGALVRIAKIARFFTPLFLALTLAPRPAVAQETTGSIQGAVVDTTGGVMPGTTVEAKNMALGTTQAATTDGQGKYRFPKLAPGKYEVTAKLQGFRPSRVTNVEIALGQIKVVNLTLEVGGLEAEVKVTGEAPIIDTKQSQSAVSIRDELIEKLPRGRNFDSVVTIAPGTASENKLAGISIDGASGAENRFIIDGIDTTDLQTGRSGKSMVTDFIEEVQVKSSGFAAEFGGATGGVINVVTKSGGEVMTGEMGMYYGGEWLNGDVNPSLRINPDTDEDAEYITYPKDTFDRIEPGFGIGGRIVSNKLWYFASYLPQVEGQLRNVTFNPSGINDDFRRNYRTHFATANITTQINEQLRGRFGMSNSSQTRKGAFPALDGTSNPNFDWSGWNTDYPNWSFSGNLDYNPTNNLFFSVKAGHFRKNTLDEGIPNTEWLTVSGQMTAFPEIPASLIRPSGFNSIPTNSASTFDLQTRTSVGFDTTWFAKAGGDHTFKAGLQWDRIGNEVQSGYQQPRYNFRYNQTLTTLDGQRVRGQYGYYRVFSIVTTGDIASNNMGMFVQDQWAVNKHLTLNLGVRTETEKVPSYRTDLGQAENAIDFGFGDKFAPRLGFSYDVKGDGSWKAYGSWGIFYDITKLEMPRGSFGGDQWLDYRYSMDTYDWTAYPTAGCPPACPGTFYEVVDFRHPSNDPNDPTIDPDLKPMKSQEFTFGLQHELSAAQRIGIRYVHKQLDRTIEDVGIIVPGIGEVFYIANPGFGVAKNTVADDCPTCPAQPKATRDYDGVEFEYARRMTNKLGLRASYLWSRLHGNYSGLASSDEDGRSSPNVNRFFDNIIMSFDANGQPVFGALATDRPHQVKLQAIYDLPWGTTISGNLYVASGTPVSRQVDIQSSTPVFYQGRESDGRTPVFSQTDFYLEHNFDFGEGRKFGLSLNVLNLFGQRTATSIYNIETRDVIGIDNYEQFFAGIDVAQLIQDQEIRTDPRFLQESAYQDPRSIRLAFKYYF